MWFSRQLTQGVRSLLIRLPASPPAGSITYPPNSSTPHRIVPDGKQERPIDHKPPWFTMPIGSARYAPPSAPRQSASSPASERPMSPVESSAGL